MKTATIPSVRVEPEFRAELEAVLREGESLSAFVEKTLRDAVSWRREQAEFHARARATSEAIRRGEQRTYSVEEVRERLQRQLDDAVARYADRNRGAA